MPFAMTHINIALEILRYSNNIKKPEDFLLGSLAPDAIHFRAHYNSDMKFKSHLCVGSEKWGNITNNVEWEDNVIEFMKNNLSDENRDFLYGYCCHILADIQNNRKVWTPFKVSIEGNTNPGIGKKYHEESNDIDYELYRQSSKAEIWDFLSRANAFDIPGIIDQSEIVLMRNEIIHERFTNRSHTDVSNNDYVTLPIIEKFINEESNHIMNILFK